MNVEFEKRFLKDLEIINENKFFIYFENLIKILKNSNGLRNFTECKKLKDSKIYYRFKFKDFRIGISYENGKVKFIRALHRKEIYRFFP